MQYNPRPRAHMTPSCIMLTDTQSTGPTKPALPLTFAAYMVHVGMFKACIAVVWWSCTDRCTANVGSCGGSRWNFENLT